MTYEAKILCDSIANNVRLTTMQITFPRIVLAEFNTHRMFSRSSASSRAIPVEKRIEAVRSNPFIPSAFSKNIRGMQAGHELDDGSQEHARNCWMSSCETALREAAELAALGVHKQWANRLLEPFSWHTVIVTATEWANFFALRCSPMAQPEIRAVAEMMREVMAASTPVPLATGEWHLPLVWNIEDFGQRLNANLSLGDWAKISAARCARVSYLTHEGKRDLEADLALYDRLISSGHWSPLEHAARPAVSSDGEGVLMAMGISDECGAETRNLYYGNLKGWVSLRKTIPGERVFVPQEKRA